jgi:hypothetical protein
MVEVNQVESQAEKAAIGHETSDANVRGVLGFAAGLVVFVVASLIVVAWLFHYFAAREERMKRPLSALAASERGRLPPEPRLEGLEHARQLEQPQGPSTGTPQGYGWVDREAGIVRIPIENAMNIIAEKLPSRPPEAEGELYGQSSGKPSDSNSGRIPRRQQP